MNQKQTKQNQKTTLPLGAPWVPSRTLLTILLAVAVVLALISGVFGGLLARYAVLDKGESTPFRYTKTDITDYVADFSATLVTGKTDVPGKDVKPTAVDDETVKKYINDILLDKAASTATGKLNKTAAVDYADVLYLRLLWVSENGQRIENAPFGGGYGATTLQIGAWAFGEEFDEKLVGLIPAETGKLTFLDHGALSALLAEATALSVTYNATIEGEDEVYESANSLRLDLNDPADALLCDKLLSVCETVGQLYTFTLTHDIDEDGEDEKVEYQAKIDAVVKEENVKEITFALPDDYFTDEDNEEYGLNGETVTFHFVIESSVACAANTFESMTASDMTVMTETLGFAPDAADDIAKKREKLFAFVKNGMKDSYNETEKNTAVSLIIEAILEDLTFGELPKKAVEEAYEMMYVSFLNDFYYNGGSAEYADLIAFGPAYFGYDAEEYESPEKYLNEYLVPNYVKQQLLLCGIYYELIDDPKGAKLTEAYNGWVDDLVASAGTGATKELVVAQYGEEYIRMLAITDLATEYLLENNSVNWELAPETEK